MPVLKVLYLMAAAASTAAFAVPTTGRMLAPLMRFNKGAYDCCYYCY